ncbi:MAG TPA: divalent-cation tolerance protein CutA [Actinocrinis sp.]|uniref:divalent-cation tolerance protein CutA n=1 Tax=Actinocrinis sp. TaxID=1920516 RepID=UPI002DDD7F03|nr:divalent-cation tolerance protein CutA [Actinocrinis sp.]HEV2344358.1 divalent-cation tolerance protein CutA [Actinocrinis sp.]
MTDFVTVTTTTDSTEEAQRLSTSAVEARLAACGQVSSPITSTYWWQGKVETATEFLIEFKTRASLADRLTEHLKTNHSYDTPEVVVTPITGGNSAYLEWIAAETPS